jgi:hypothetical protein
MRHRFFGAVVASFVMGAGSILFACSGAGGEAAEQSSSDVTGLKNLCVGQAAATFHCIDDTRFEECLGNGQFVVESCPKGLCATRHPPNQNPCIGAALAAQIDGVPPTPPNQTSDNGAGSAGGATNNAGGATNAGGAATATGNTGGASASSSTSSGSTSSGNTGGSNNGQCVGGPKFDPAGAKNVGNGVGKQFIGGQCLSAKDCASGCCAFPCGICSGPGAQFQAGKMGCGFGG